MSGNGAIRKDASDRVIRGGCWDSVAGTAARRIAPGRAVAPVRRPGLSCGPGSARRESKRKPAQAKDAWSEGRGGGKAEPDPSCRSGRRVKRPGAHFRASGPFPEEQRQQIFSRLEPLFPAPGL